MNALFMFVMTVRKVLSSNYFHYINMGVTKTFFSIETDANGINLSIKKTSVSDPNKHTKCKFKSLALTFNAWHKTIANYL